MVNQTLHDGMVHMGISALSRKARRSRFVELQSVINIEIAGVERRREQLGREFKKHETTKKARESAASQC